MSNTIKPSNCIQIKSVYNLSAFTDGKLEEISEQYLLQNIVSSPAVVTELVFRLSVNSHRFSKIYFVD